MDSFLKIIRGAVKVLGSDGTQIGNSGDKLKTEVTFPANNYHSGSLGALRVINSQNVFESLFSFDKQPLIWDESLTGAATSTWDSNSKSIIMTLPTTSGASVVRQTFRRIYYNPSRTIQVFSAGVLGSPKSNVRKRIGQFDTLDGVYFELDGLIPNVVRRTSTSGAAIDVKTPQSSWNIDKFDGTGPSGITIDFSKTQLFYVQYSFTGFGDIVYGFYANGRVNYAHRETVSNILSLPSMRTAHLPCRVEITNTGTTASNTSMSYGSFSIRNEGELSDKEGQILSYSDAPLKTIGLTSVPVVSVKLATGYERAIADIIKTGIFVQTADEVIWTIWVNPTLTGATFAISKSYTTIDIAATALSGGTEILSGIISNPNSAVDISQDLLKFVNSSLGSSLAGVNTVITLAARCRVGTADILSNLVWKEYP